MEVEWRGKLELNYTSCGCMHMEVDWGGKLIVNSMVDWGAHGTHPNGHNISEVDWGGHDSSSNHMNEFLLSEVDYPNHRLTTTGGSLAHHLDIQKAHHQKSHP